MRIEQRRFDHPDVQQLIDKVQAHYIVLYGGVDLDKTEPAEFAPPNGTFLVGYLDGVPVTCGGWRLIAPDRAEIKRMYTVEEHRGRGLARELLAALESSAAAAGMSRMVLSTGSPQVEAMALYASSGYDRTDERYGHYADVAGAHFFTKKLKELTKKLTEKP